MARYDWRLKDGKAAPASLRDAIGVCMDLRIFLTNNIVQGRLVTSMAKKEAKKALTELNKVQRALMNAEKGQSPVEEKNMDTGQFKSFKDAIGEVQENLDENKKMEKMMDFIGDKLENSSMDVDQLKKAFVKKFGRSAEKHYQSILSNFLD